MLRRHSFTGMLHAALPSSSAGAASYLAGLFAAPYLADLRAEKQHHMRVMAKITPRATPTPMPAFAPVLSPPSDVLRSMISKLEAGIELEAAPFADGTVVLAQRALVKLAMLSAADTIMLRCHAQYCLVQR